MLFRSINNYDTKDNNDNNNNNNNNDNDNNNNYKDNNDGTTILNRLYTPSFPFSSLQSMSISNHSVTSSHPDPRTEVSGMNISSPVEKDNYDNSSNNNNNTTISSKALPSPTGGFNASRSMSLMEYEKSNNQIVPTLPSVSSTTSFPALPIRANRDTTGVNEDVPILPPSLFPSPILPLLCPC